MSDLDAEMPVPFGERCEVSGHELATYRSGAGDVPVVLLPGGGSVGLDMWRVQEGVAQFAAVLGYDRGGTGWSGRDVKLPRTLADATEILRKLTRCPSLDGRVAAAWAPAAKQGSPHPRSLTGMSMSVRVAPSPCAGLGRDRGFGVCRSGRARGCRLCVCRRALVRRR